LNFFQVGKQGKNLIYLKFACAIVINPGKNTPRKEASFASVRNFTLF